jgi:hypothetical protein
MLDGCAQKMLLKICTVTILCISLNGCAPSNGIITGSVASTAPGIQIDHTHPAPRPVTTEDVLAMLCQKRLDDAKANRQSEHALTLQQRQANERACAHWQADRNRIAANR